MKVERAIAKDMKYFAVTCDGWSSRANHSYNAVTLHYIDSNWEMCDHLLEVAASTVDHTAQNLAACLEDAFARWKLPISCLSGMTTDNARNIISALDSLEWPHLGCFAHTIQLSVQKAMEVPEVAKALGRARRLVGHFHHSVKSTNILRQKQKDLHYPESSLSQDVATRWNSAYFMVESILKQQQPLCATLLEIRKTDLMPNDSEITCMEIFLEVMKPFVEITQSVGGEKWVTLSLVRPLLHKLVEKHLVEDSSDSRLKKNVKSVILRDLKTRYQNTLASQLLNNACFMDPRFKSLSFFSEREKDQVVSCIREEAEALEETETESPETEPPEKRQKKESTLMSLLEGIIEPSVEENKKEKVKKELDKYFCIDGCTDGKPLVWWKNYEGQFPLLAKLAKRYLCIPATSVPSERAFSAAGNVVNAKRACLLPENVNMLVFLSQNLD